MALRNSDGKVINVAHVENKTTDNENEKVTDEVRVPHQSHALPHPAQVSSIVFTTKLHMQLVELSPSLAAALWMRPSLFHVHANTGGLNCKWSEGVYFSEQIDRSIEGDIFYKYVFAKDRVEFIITDTDNYWTYQGDDMSDNFMSAAIDILTTVESIIRRVSQLGNQ